MHIMHWPLDYTELKQFINAVKFLIQFNKFVAIF